MTDPYIFCSQIAICSSLLFVLCATYLHSKYCLPSRLPLYPFLFCWPVLKMLQSLICLHTKCRRCSRDELKKLCTPRRKVMWASHPRHIHHPSPWSIHHPTAWPSLWSIHHPSTWPSLFHPTLCICNPCHLYAFDLTRALCDCMHFTFVTQVVFGKFLAVLILNIIVWVDYFNSWLWIYSSILSHQGRLLSLLQGAK